MALSSMKLGELIEAVDIRNFDSVYTAEDVMGISVNKILINTKADLTGVNLKSYKVLKKGQFAYCLVTSRNGDKISLVFNDQKDCLISPINPVFKIKDENILDPYYLMMFFKRSEFDRYARFNSWGSARETFDWNDFCDTELKLPSIDVQKKYISVYKAIKKNIFSIQSGIDECDYACHIKLDKILHSMPLKSISTYIEQTDQRNNNITYGEDSVKGMTITKEVIPTKANVSTTDLSNFLVVNPSEFVYNPRTHGKKIGLAFNQSDSAFIISWNNTAFRIKPEKTKELLPEYLYLCFCRDEWDRAACFRSWGSSTEVFTWEALCETEIAIPSIEMQKDIVDIYKAYIKRKNILEKLIEIEKTICPILISGAIKEGGAK